MDLSKIRLSGADSRLTRAVFQSPRLAAMLPSEVEELATAYEAATATVDEAAKLPTQDVDVLALVDADLRAGKPANPATLVRKLAEASAKNEQRQRTINELSRLPEHYKQEILRVVNRSVDGFYVALGEQLTEVLDAAQVLLADLGDVTTAEQAIDAGKATEWARFRALGKQYAEIRATHLDLLRAEDLSGFKPDSTVIGFAFYEAIEAAVPNYIPIQREGVNHPDYAGFKRHPLPFNLNDPADPAHFLATVRDRSLLRPFIGDADWAKDKHRAASERYREATEPAPGKVLDSALVAQYGSERAAMENSVTARAIRTQAGSQRQRDAALDARYGKVVPASAGGHPLVG